MSYFSSYTEENNETFIKRGQRAPPPVTWGQIQLAFFRNSSCCWKSWHHTDFVAVIIIMHLKIWIRNAGSLSLITRTCGNMPTLLVLALSDAGSLWVSDSTKFGTLVKAARHMIEIKIIKQHLLEVVFYPPKHVLAWHITTCPISILYDLHSMMQRVSTIQWAQPVCSQTESS